MRTPLDKSKAKDMAKEPSGGIRGSVMKHIFAHMLDAVPGSFKILICDAPAANVLNSCLRMHDLMSHGVTLLEDLQTTRQPIITSPALYFFSPDDSTVERVIQDWVTKDPYKEAHLFALGTTSDRFLQQLAQSRMASKVLSFKDMMLDFSAPESLVFHLNMQNDLAQLLTSTSGTARDIALDIAASRLASVIHALNNGVPTIRYQGKSRICPTFAKLFFEKLAKLCHDVPEFKNGGENGENPIVVIVDRSFDTTAPLIHVRSYQCLLEELMHLENNIYEQTFKDRAGNDAKRQFPLDEEDMYWCQYRHRFFANCLEDLPAALKKLHQDNPNLAQGLGHGGDVSDLGSAVRALPEFQEKQAKLSLHIDICTRLMALYRDHRLAEVCEIEQDIVTERKPFKVNLESVRRLAKDASIPQQERLRLVLLLSAASNTSDFTEAKKQQLIQESGLMAEANRFSNLELITSRVGMLRRDGTESDQTRRTGMKQSAPPSPRGGEGDTYVNQAFLLMEAVARNTLNTADYPVMNSPYEVAPTPAGGTESPATVRKTLRMGLALASMKRPDGTGTNGAERVGGGLAAAAARNAKGGGSLNLRHEGGVVPLQSSQRIVILVLGGLTYGEMRSAYQAASKLGREVIIGGTSLLRGETFMQELCNLR